MALHRRLAAVARDIGDDDGWNDAERLAADLWEVTADGLSEGEAVTDVEGKYAIKDLRGGPYVVVATADSGANRVAWLVPVEVAGADVSVDLHEGNALIVDEKSTRRSDGALRLDRHGGRCFGRSGSGVERDRHASVPLVSR